MLTALRSWWSGSAVLAAGGVDDLLGRIVRLRERFPGNPAEAGASSGPRLALVDAEMAQLKSAIKLDTAGKVEAVQWDARPKDERQRLSAALERVFDELRWLTRDERAVGRTYFVVFVALLVALALVYVTVHRQQRPSSVAPAKIVAVARELRQLELEVNAQRARKAAKEALPEAEQKKLAEALKSRVAELKKEVDGVDLSFATLRLLGTVDGEAERGTLLDAGDSLVGFRAAVLADLESLRAGFLWNDRRGRWFEIAWWAEFGVLVGILFYIAGTLAEGRFETENIEMFWAEIVIAPIVVLVIFFLFALTGITGISPTETAITGNVGFAFIFGFAIRRTIGLLDIIKKRVFPEPSP